MRNLKRVLSLTLASVMLLGMMVIGSSAAEAKKINFTDAGEIEYNEAVDVMVALGVLEGNPNGDFNPQGTLTREQAAKIISCMLLGPENAEKLTNNTVIFSDVAAGRWSAGYIAYCAQQGILAGTGNGAFNPTGELTGAAFGKMLLVALGYDPSIQIYTGSSWAISVASDMLDAGIDVSGTVLSAPLTREQAAQMAFQTLEADIVDYANRGTVVDLGNGQSVSINASKPEPVRATGSQNYNEADNESHDGVYQQFCEKYFTKLLKKNLAEGDELGRPGYAWEVDGAEVSTYAEGAKYVLKDEFTGKDLYNTVGKTAASDDYTWTVYEDGADITSNTDGDSDTMQDNAADKDADAKYAGNGTVTEIYVDTTKDAEKVTVCVINTYAAEIDKVNTEADVDDDENPNVEITHPGEGTLSFDTVAFEEDDVVYYTVGQDDQDNTVIVTMALADSIEGEVTKVTRNKDFTVDGTVYKYNKTMSDGDKVAVGTVGNDVKMYLDGNGYVVFKGEADASKDYAYVVSIGSTKDRYDSNNWSYYAKLLLTDGTLLEADLKTLDAWKTSPDGTEANGLATKIVTYTEDDGEYTLTVKGSGLSAAITDNTHLDIEKGVARMKLNSATKNVTADSETVFLVCEKNDGKDCDVYVGYKNVPNIKGMGNASKVAYYVEDGVAKVVYVQGSDAETGSSDDIIFIVGDSTPTDVETNDGTYHEYDAVMDGKATKLEVLKDSAADTALIAAGDDVVKVAKSVKYNSKNFVTSYVDYSAYTDSTGDGWKDANAVGTKKASKDNVTFGTEVWSYSDDVVIAKKDGDKITTGGISMVSTDDNDEAILVLKDDSLIAAFITVRASDYTPPVAPHVHELTWSSQQAAQAATCNAKGHVAYYTVTCADSDGQCTLTGDEKYASTNGDSTTDPGTALTDEQYETAIDPTNHDYAAGWTADGSKHWHVCNNGCGTKGTEGAHVGEPSDGSATAGTGDQAGVTHTWTCTTCNETATGSCTHPGDGACPACGAAKPVS